MIKNQGVGALEDGSLSRKDKVFRVCFLFLSGLKLPYTNEGGGAPSKLLFFCTLSMHILINFVKIIELLHCTVFSNFLINFNVWHLDQSWILEESASRQIFWV